VQLVQDLQFSCSSSQEIYLAQFLTPHILGHTWFKTPGIMLRTVAYPGILFGGGVQQIQLRTEDRENRDLEAVAP
jgi:hypothetical protein